MYFKKFQKILGFQVKYRKHKKNNKAGVVVSGAAAALGVKAVMEANGKVMAGHHKSPVVEQQQQQPPPQTTPPHGLMNGVPRIANGNILKTALTNPSEVLHLRRRLESAVTSSRDAVTLPYESAMPTICTLIYCDEFEDIATLKLDELLDTKAELSDKLCQIGDSIVYKLVQWTKRLPFYSELPVEVRNSTRFLLTTEM